MPGMDTWACVPPAGKVTRYFSWEVIDLCNSNLFFFFLRTKYLIPTRIRKTVQKVDSKTFLSFFFFFLLKAASVFCWSLNTTQQRHLFWWRISLRCCVWNTEVLCDLREQRDERSQLFHSLVMWWSKLLHFSEVPCCSSAGGRSPNPSIPHSHFLYTFPGNRWLSHMFVWLLSNLESWNDFFFPGKIPFKSVVHLLAFGLESSHAKHWVCPTAKHVPCRGGPWMSEGSRDLWKWICWWS